MTPKPLDDPKRFVKKVDRKQLEVGSWGGAEYKWLGVRLNIDDIKTAEGKLFKSLRIARKRERLKGLFFWYLSESLVPSRVQVFYP